MLPYYIEKFLCYLNVLGNGYVTFSFNKVINRPKQSAQHCNKQRINVV